ncbi:unnamed protein product [Penicillium salamii]|uniref:Pleiotropic ABC efflux transporter N-terminal domain-containing protein n=1 Tax=Penicillium salamii TaxID=1612424 RepID=A0A9W4JSM9_9EURO|nr:unnamed protein product [Penicillium salamii]
MPETGLPRGFQESVENMAPVHNEKEELTDMAEKQDQVAKLARSFSHQSTQQKPLSLCNEEQPSFLDPSSPDFDAKEWAKSFYNLRHNTEGSTSRRIAGFAAQKMDVGGYGAGVDYQMNVGNAGLKLTSQAANFVRKRAMKAQRVNILQDVEALVLPGEQLCVLGPPGSGCSTFLKTVAGLTYGLDVADTSYLN